MIEPSIKVKGGFVMMKTPWLAVINKFVVFTGYVVLVAIASGMA